MSHKVRKTALLKAYAKMWTAFEQVPITEQMRDDHPQLKHCLAIYANSRFECQIFAVGTSIGGVQQLVVCRHGDIAKIDWEELQRVVHELFGPEVTAVEVYPSIQHEWQTKTNARVLWVLPSTWELPFGLEKPGAWGKPA